MRLKRAALRIFWRCAAIFRRVTRRRNFPHASDLINAIRREGADFLHRRRACGGTPNASDGDADIDGVRRKVESGCVNDADVFDNNILYNYMFKLLRHDITVPVIAGIMPVTNAKQNNAL